MSVTENNEVTIPVAYPGPGDADMGELKNFETMLHSLVSSLFGGYPVPSKYQVYNACKQGMILSQSLFSACEQVSDRYVAAAREEHSDGIGYVDKAGAWHYGLTPLDE